MCITQLKRLGLDTFWGTSLLSGGSLFSGYLRYLRSFDVSFGELLRSFSNDDGDGSEAASNNRFNKKKKQSLCTCVLNFCTFLCRSLQRNDVK